MMKINGFENWINIYRLDVVIISMVSMMYLNLHICNIIYLNDVSWEVMLCDAMWWYGAAWCGVGGMFDTYKR